MTYSPHGEILEEVTLQTQAWRNIAARVIRPNDSPQTLSFMRQEADRWRMQANGYYQLYQQGQLPKAIYTRAYFAGEVLWSAASLLHKGRSQVLLVEQDGAILGVATYKYQDSRASISLQATEPVHQPTTPNGDKIRGIGTSLTRAMGREFLARGVQRVALVPLDDAAEAFWTGRHFHDGVQPPILHLDGPEEIKCLVTACSVDLPDMPDEGDLAAAGGWDEIWGSVLPEVKRRLL